MSLNLQTGACVPTSTETDIIKPTATSTAASETSQPQTETDTPLLNVTDQINGSDLTFLQPSHLTTTETRLSANAGSLNNNSFDSMEGINETKPPETLATATQSIVLAAEIVNQASKLSASPGEQ